MQRPMRVLAALWVKEWQALARDVHGLAVLFALPAAFIVIMSLALSDVFRDGATRKVEFAVLAATADISQAMADDIAGEGFTSTAAPESEAAAREQVRKGRLALVLVVSEKFGADQTAKLKVLADPTLPPITLAAFLQRLQGVTL